MSLAWYINRLRAMSPPEIAHRVREHRRRARWRRYAGGWSRFEVGDGALPVLAAIGERLEAACRQDAALARRVEVECGRLLAGDVTMLGRRWPEGTLAGLAPGDARLFHRDPVGGAVWPEADAYCFDVPYRHVSGPGDIKYLWEINRLQFLQPAALHARLTGDGDLARRVLGLVLAWMDGNPPFRGPNWCSGIELACRTVTLVVVLSCLGAPAGAAERARLRALLHAHAFWLARYPSRYSSANNHAIAEGLGLFLAGLLVPDLPGARRHEAEGRHLIERECLVQILPDGVGVEQSPTYTAFSMEMIAFATLAGDLAGRPLSAAVHARLALAAEHLAWLMGASGGAPAIGDNDEGRIVATSVDAEMRYACSVAACIDAGHGGSGAYDRPPELREALFRAAKGGTIGAGAARAAAGAVKSGPGAANGRAAASPDPAGVTQRAGLRTFEAGGYSIVRGEVAGRPTVLTFDHGPLGWLSIAAHGHADALAIWLDVAGRPVLVDAGTWLYHAGGAMRDWLRSTAAHNTVLVEEASQSIPSGAFNWSHKAGARLTGAGGSIGDTWWIEGAHDGYVKRFGVTHVRRLFEIGPDTLAVTDQLVGGGAPRRAAIRFLLAPDLAVSATPRGFELRRDDGLVVAIEGPERLVARRIDAAEGAPEGWVSDRFGHKLASTLLAFEGSLGAAPVTTRIAMSFPGTARGRR